VPDIKKLTLRNDNFRTVIWTGQQLQATLMSIPVGEEIGLEAHKNIDQFLRIEEGRALVQMGEREDALTFEQKASENSAIFVPAGMFHNIINIGKKPLKLYSIYAPPEHAYGAVHKNADQADREELAELMDED
jgi:mannose-6-phosphate isomerase-like protein (cupin superfamily)